MQPIALRVFRRPLVVSSFIVAAAALMFLALRASEPTTLTLPNQKCRNDGYTASFGRHWVLNDSAPPEWRGRSPVAGHVRHLRFTGWAYFEADGVELALVAEGTGIDLRCTPWEVLGGG